MALASWSYRAPTVLSDAQLKRWAELLESRTGIDLSQHPSILNAGLQRRWREIDCGDIEAYFEHVSSWPGGIAEWMALVDCIAVQETSFFRQRDAFDLVYRFLLRRLETAAPTLDLWSVGCASGEEAYSLAMVALRARQRRPGTPYSGVLATDISQRALRTARTGRYTQRRMESIPEPLRGRYWEAGNGGEWASSAALREQVCFVQGNAMELERTPFVPMDVIFCQNVLVYFRRWRRHQVLDALASRLKPGGMLIVGAGEASQWQHATVTRLRHPSVQAYVRGRDDNKHQGALDSASGNALENALKGALDA